MICFLTQTRAVRYEKGFFDCSVMLVKWFVRDEIIICLAHWIDHECQLIYQNVISWNLNFSSESILMEISFYIVSIPLKKRRGLTYVRTGCFVYVKLVSQRLKNRRTLCNKIFLSKAMRFRMMVLFLKSSTLILINLRWITSNHRAIHIIETFYKMAMN